MTTYAAVRLRVLSVCGNTDLGNTRNTGDYRFCRDGVWELRIDVGPGYRVYYARAGEATLLLLWGGRKRTQSRDITRAVEYWNDYQQRL
jgi:putative addiction module killer protein